MSKGEYRQDEGAVCFHGDAHGLLGNVFSESELNKYVINKELHGIKVNNITNPRQYQPHNFQTI